MIPPPTPSLPHDRPGSGTCRCLATDLDGTLIPLASESDNRRDLPILADTLQRDGVALLFVTGRHFESVLQAIRTVPLPHPDGIICDVGASIYRRGSSGAFVPVDEYGDHLHQIVAAMPVERLREQLNDIRGLCPQESEKQGRFKLSYYLQRDFLETVGEQIQQRLDRIEAPYSMIRSVDPFTGDGLMDLLPRNVSKAYALAWWADHTQTPPDHILFAGDSGNDTAALTAGYRAILVGNAEPSLADQIRRLHDEAGWRDRLIVTQAQATSGVLEGYRHYRASDTRLELSDR